MTAEKPPTSGDDVDLDELERLHAKALKKPADDAADDRDNNAYEMALLSAAPELIRRARERDEWKRCAEAWRADKKKLWGIQAGDYDAARADVAMLAEALREIEASGSLACPMNIATRGRCEDDCASCIARSALAALLSADSATPGEGET